MNTPSDDRLLRLEEAHGFLERDVESLNAEFTRLHRRLAELAARLDRIEQGGAAVPEPGPGPALTLDQAERQTIADALARAGGGRDAAAQSLGIDRATLERKLIRHGLA